jgi:flavin reductase (DIM6/NTAB) family NADH-FMN oxidoreductase RutF
MATSMSRRPGQDAGTQTAAAGVPDARQLRGCLGRFATGVAVVSYLADGQARGLTVNSFTSVSLDPPLILVSLARNARACEHLGQQPFAVNVLRADQLDAALQFAGQPRPGARLDWRYGHPQHAPALGGAVAVLQCRPWRTYDGGDHELHVGEVIAAEQWPGEPLLFTDGRFAMTGLPLIDGPRVVGPWPSAASPWLAQACRLHDRAGAA